MAILQYRLDGRMLHGQVSSFARALNIEAFVVVNEETANDDTQIMLLELAAMGNDVDVLSPEDACDLLLSGELDDLRTMVVFKEISDVSALIKAGYEDMDECVISGMYAKEGSGREKFAESLFVNEADKADFRFIEDHNVVLSHQISPEYNKKLVRNLVKF